MLGKGFPNAGVIYRDVVIKGLRREENNTLHLWGIYDRWDYMDVWYEDVLYSQIDETSIRLRIALVEELTFDELSELRHNMGRNRMLREVPVRYSEFMNALHREEYRLFAHYTITEREWEAERGRLELEERFVLARGVKIDGPDERYAREKEENREYKFYAFVSHAEGGEDEKAARWLGRKLKNCRVPVETITKLRSEEYAPAGLIPERFSVIGGYARAEGKTSDLARYLIVICSPRGARSDWTERMKRKKS